MRNKKQTSSTLLLCAAIFLVFAFVYLVTPPIYNKVLTKKYETREKELLEALTTDSDTEMLITRYAIENNAYLQIQGESIQYATPSISSIGDIETNHSYQSYNGKAMNLTIQYANNSVVDLNRVQMVVLPVSALILICLVCLLQFLHKDSPQGDYDKLYKATSDMLSLSDQAYLPVQSGNKKQDALYKNINTLYEQIRMSIDALKRQVDDKSMMENHLLQLLKQQGQKTSLALDEVIDMLSKMALDEGKYRNHYLYLIDAKVKLEDLQTSLNQDVSLGSSDTTMKTVDIEKYLKQLTASYELLSLKKRVSFQFNFKASFKATIKDLLFKKFFEEIMAFILLQCDSQSNILVVQNNYDIHISYQGACLTPASISQVQKEDAHLRTAFDYVKKMGFYVDFEETPKKDGMQFVIHF